MTFAARLRTTFARRAAMFAADEGGATAIEYGLIAAGISCAIISTVYSLGSFIQDTLWNKIGASIGP